MYTQCEIEAVLAAQENCDCTLTSLPRQNFPTNTNTKQQQIAQQTNWKYLVQNKFILTNANIFSLSISFQLYQSPYYLKNVQSKIFHPPCC